MSVNDPETGRSPQDRPLSPAWLLRPTAHFGAAATGGPILARPAPAPVRRPPREWHSKQQASTRAVVLSAWIGFLAAIALPVVAWHHTMASVAGRFHLSASYLITGWSGYLLLAAGVMLMAPAAVSSGLPPDHRLRPLHRGAYLSWGIVLYLLGIALASQVAALTG